MKLYIGDKSTYTIPVPIDKDPPDTVNVDIYRDGVLTRLFTGLSWLYTDVGEVRLYQPLVTPEWTIDGVYTTQAYYVVSSDELTSPYLSPEFSIQKKISVTGVSVNTISLNGSFVDTDNKTVKIDNVSATINSQNASTIVCTPATVLTEGEHSVEVSLQDGSELLFTLIITDKALSNGSIRLRVGVRVSV